MLTIRYYDRQESGFKDFNFSEKTVDRFGIVNHKTWNNNGTFKKWSKEAYIVIEGKKHTTSDLDVIKKLKELLKGKYSIEKQNECVYKNYSERKCTDWHYEIIK